MITLWRELAKIARQVKGSQNMFDYKSTGAGQLYLLYCFSGDIYFTDKIHKQVKYLWCFVIICQIAFAYAMAVEYLWYRPKNDLVMIFHVVSAIGTIHAVIFGVPLISHIFGHHIEAMIKHVDDTLTIGNKQEKIMSDAKKYLGLFWTYFFIFIGTYLSVGAFDAILFFEEDKATNYLYYPYPPPLIRKYSGDFGSFIALLCFTSVIFLPLAVEVCMVLSLVLYWGVICLNELASIRDYLHGQTCDLNERIDQQNDIFWNRWNQTFKHTLKHSAEEFQKTTRLINYLKQFVETIGTMAIISAFGVGVPLLYICASNDLSLVLKVKCATFYMNTGITVYMFYWIGQTLNNSTSEVSMAVYFTPWHESVKIRQQVYVLLCQTQTVKNFSIFKVYGLLLNNFSRYLHGLVSCTNILLKLTKTK